MKLVCNNLFEFLLESKQVGILYHIMDYSSLLFNLTNDQIGGGSNHKLSFSRSKYYSEIPNHLPKNKVLSRFVLNGDKLSNRYKIKSVKDLDIKTDEYEEQIIGIVKHLHTYLIKLQIYKEVLNAIDSYEELNKIKDVIVEYSNKYNVNIEYI